MEVAPGLIGSELMKKGHGLVNTPLDPFKIHYCDFLVLMLTWAQLKDARRE